MGDIAILSSVRIPDPKKDKEAQKAAEAAFKKLNAEIKDAITELKAMANDDQIAIRHRAIETLPERYAELADEYR